MNLFNFFKSESPKTEYAKAYLERLKLKQIQTESFVVLDFETTGLNPEKDKILSFAFLKIEQGAIQLNSCFEGYVKHLEYLIDAVEIHKVTKEDIENGLQEEAFVKRALETINSSIIVGHHIAFDYNGLDSYYSGK